MAMMVVMRDVVVAVVRMMEWSLVRRVLVMVMVMFVTLAILIYNKWCVPSS